jgi:hypothetical protein
VPASFQWGFFLPVPLQVLQQSFYLVQVLLVVVQVLLAVLLVLVLLQVQVLLLVLVLLQVLLQVLDLAFQFEDCSHKGPLLLLLLPVAES